MANSGDKHCITEEILRLVRQSIEDNRGSKAAFCRMTGITPYNLSKLLSGNKKFVYGDDWNRLCDYFPELDDRKIKIKGHCNAVNGSVVLGDNNQIGSDSVEVFRSGLIAEIIMLDIDPVAKDAVLKTITAYRRGGK
ncbi:helix-turn-helix transcriptional regulator [Victivallis sp. Marseille-Q1083]|uniref:helix-turn-helix domain-containing protein n=1 Tax=Victivallis sp. Marseille-Q1083 TaxID=2717288 RepID=UPI00158B0145|nr:helix-turn-helix transcriptional regulator [Victivallis sp. Marseille-Q1083]